MGLEFDIHEYPSKAQLEFSRNSNFIFLAQPHYLRKVGEWCDNNKIALNVKKSKHLISGPRMFLKESDNIIVYKNLQLGNVDCYTYLGIKIDKCLNFEKQLDATITKVNGRLVTFAKTRRFMDKSTSSLVYKQTIMPYFDYHC